MSKVGRERSTVVLGTRGSKLAVHQSEWVQAQLHALAPHVTVTLRKIQTSGDKILDVPLAQIGGKGAVREGDRGSAIERRNRSGGA